MCLVLSFTLGFRINMVCHPIAHLMAPLACQEWGAQWTDRQDWSVRQTALCILPWWTTISMHLMVSRFSFSTEFCRANRLDVYMPHDLNRIIIFLALLSVLCLSWSLFIRSPQTLYGAQQSTVYVKLVFKLFLLDGQSVNLMMGLRPRAIA